MTAPSVARLRCEHLPSPAYVDRPRPRFSWQVTSPRRGALQTSYRLVVAAGGEVVWDTGRVESPDCVLVPYAGRALRSRELLSWSVRVWDHQGLSSQVARGAFEMGLLSADDWLAGWIAAPGHRPGDVSYLRSTLTVRGPVRRARAYVTALGLYELRCNGTRVGAARFTPGWTDYRTRLQYQVLDLTDLLVEGDNGLMAVLSEGWYAGHVGSEGKRGHYGDTPELLAQVEVETAAGRQVHVTGADWLAGRGPILTSDLLQGEHQDHRVPLGEWQPVRVGEGPAGSRALSPAPPVRVTEERAPVRVERVGPDTHRIDLGQNLVGWLRLRLSSSGTVTVRHAEVLEEDGSLHVANLRTAAATDTYCVTESGWVEPAFTFHGFRFAEVSGHRGDLTAADVVAVVCGSALRRVGDFECSDPAVDQLHSNIVWSARGNFLEIPTDCPQRDERMGWTGDVQVFAPTASYLFDTAGFLTKWLRDLVDAQRDGRFPDVAPLVVLRQGGTPGWADAGVIVPWLMWERYADRDLLTELLPAMRSWVEHVHAANPSLLWLNERGNDFGDWLAAHSTTDKDLIATAFFFHSARLLTEAAAVLGVEAPDLSERIGAAFREAYLLPDGRLTSGTQTAYALALRFGLIPPEAAAHLARDVEVHDHHLTTGFLGVVHLLPALSDAGYDALAYRLLLQDDYPSWLHAVRAGATTTWERWDGWTKEVGYGDPIMNSYNHYALGSVGEWLYSTVAGIRYDEPGGRRMSLAPHPNRSLEWVRASHRTPLGLVRVEWRYLPDGWSFEAEVPVGATATVRLPGGDPEAVREGGNRLSDVEGVAVREVLDGEVVLDVGSGTYRFVVGGEDAG